jgi:hypothetical protein
VSDVFGLSLLSLLSHIDDGVWINLIEPGVTLNVELCLDYLDLMSQYLVVLNYLVNVEIFFNPLASFLKHIQLLLVFI